MRILFCTNSFHHITNGPAKFANLILEINAIYPEHEIRILTEDVEESNNNVYKLYFKIPKFLKPFGQVLRMFQYHKAAMDIYNQDFKFDIIVYNNAFIGLWSAIKFSKTVGMINDDNNSSRTLSNFKFNYVNIKQIIFKFFESLSIRFHKKIITNSEYLTLQLIKAYSHGKEKYVKMYKAIEPINKMSNANFCNRPVKILFVKNDYKRGGLTDLLQACNEMKFEIELIIVGPDESKIDLNTLNKIKNSNQRIQLLGPLSQTKVFELLEQSHVFCVPSHQEALGVANIEALARGVAVVSTNVGGIPEVLNYGECGWLVPPADINALKNAIEECVNNNDLREFKKNNGLRHVAIFDKNIVFGNFLSILHEA